VGSSNTGRKLPHVIGTQTTEDVRTSTLRSIPSSLKMALAIVSTLASSKGGLDCRRRRNPKLPMALSSRSKPASETQIVASALLQSSALRECAESDGKTAVERVEKLSGKTGSFGKTFPEAGIVAISGCDQRGRIAIVKGSKSSAISAAHHTKCRRAADALRQASVISAAARRTREDLASSSHANGNRMDGLIGFTCFGFLLLGSLIQGIRYLRQ